LYKKTLQVLALCVGLQVLQTLCPHRLEMLQVFRIGNLFHLNTLPLCLLTLITHMFSHAGWDHLLGNMSVGIPAMMYVERRLGSKKMLDMYVITGIVAALTQCIMPFAAEGLIGASGAIFGMVGASCLLLCNGGASTALGMGVLGLVLIPQIGEQAFSAVSTTAHAAHIAGCVAGLVMVGMHYKDKDKKAHKE
jgi:membrane associated rhomboid family serine protease